MADDHPDAIRINVPITLILTPICAGTFGFVSGLLTSAEKASLQFLAENAHRQPTTVQGWYFYQKTKNYRVLLGGARGGLLTGAKLAGWTTAFVGLEEVFWRHGFSRSRTSAAQPGSGWTGSRAASGACSGTLLAIAAGTFYKLPWQSASRRLLLGLSVGALAGSLEDLQSYLKSRLPERE
ncbi:uncharacterized protein L969DRAFT_238168 [Mixia osmundae IAM 14324]|uniref:Uncharacterized protein n=1 Tax=Mixia osmundae (strain CBS 9802 / IAM 14324 / JCM 22182 / KY 12970) TaxID=764103 RepID=G7E2K5_MIXOS|nr:uncharacterized protein L969DRAFT_238168 [Mixia osmundae IAM 14324]KEI36934.1 hypothetical protein L969DRAFT_238168 [Mixia osmundae IAM 14324]GAA97065.1 hypothetical protein E5Q_03740 [Mixia osmundae IAM 14324]